MSFEKIYGWYERLLRILAGTSMTVIVVVMVVQVIARYVFNASIIWAEEFCRYLLVWQTFLFAGLAYKRGEMVAVEVVPLMLTPGARLVLKVVATTPVLIFLWLMVTNGYDYAGRFANQTLPAIDFIWMSLTGGPAGWSVFWVYVSVSVGMALLALHLIGSVIEDWLALRRPQQQKSRV